MGQRNPYSRPTPADFGDLFHGTAVPGLTSIDASRGKSLYPGMDRGYAQRRQNYVTTDPEEAANYAKHAADKLKYDRPDARPVVYRVKARQKASFEPDPNSGPSGWEDGPKSRRESFEMAANGVHVALRFNEPLKVLEEHDPDSDTFKDYLSGFHERWR